MSDRPTNQRTDIQGHKEDIVTDLPTNQPSRERRKDRQGHMVEVSLPIRDTKDFDYFSLNDIEDELELNGWKRMKAGNHVGFLSFMIQTNSITDLTGLTLSFFRFIHRTHFWQGSHL